MCSPQTEGVLKDSSTFTNWKTMLSNQLNTLLASQVKTTDTFISLVGVANSINSVSNCVNEKMEHVQSVATDIANLQTRLATLDKTMDERKKDVDVSKHRAEMTRNPELTRSYYDGWFPIQRPLKHYTIPVLIGISLFLMTLSFLYFMSLIGIDTRLSVRVPVTYGTAPSQFTRAFWVMSGISVILLGLTIYGFRK
jgi:hypothetical protein